MLSLEKRDCILGWKATADGKESEDGEDVKTLKLELSAIPLDKRELNALLCEPHAWDVLYNTGGEIIEPYLKGLKELELASAIEGAWLALELGLKSVRYEFADVKLSKVKLTLGMGGETLLSCKVTLAQADTDTLASVFEKLGASVEVELRLVQPGAQQDLPLNNFGEGEQPPAKSKRVRKSAPRADLN